MVNPSTNIYEHSCDTFWDRDIQTTSYNMVLITQFHDFRAIEIFENVFNIFKRIQSIYIKVPRQPNFRYYFNFFKQIYRLLQFVFFNHNGIWWSRTDFMAVSDTNIAKFDANFSGSHYVKFSTFTSEPRQRALPGFIVDSKTFLLQSYLWRHRGKYGASKRVRTQ